jgi:hypothetical protein
MMHYTGHTLWKSSRDESSMRPSAWKGSIGVAGMMNAPREIFCLFIETGRLKALLSAPRPPAIPRPMKVSLPAVNFTTLAGKYHNSGYGSLELCLISPKNPLASSSCQALASNISVILPGAIDPMIPTFVSEWNTATTSHLRVTHFNGNFFNISTFTSYVSWFLPTRTIFST